MSRPSWPAVVSANIRSETARNQLTYAQLAREIGMNRSAVGYRWRDERQWTLAEIEAVAAVLKVTPVGLCREEGVQPEDRTGVKLGVVDSEAFRIHRRKA